MYETTLVTLYCNNSQIAYLHINNILPFFSICPCTSAADHIIQTWDIFIHDIGLFYNFKYKDLGGTVDLNVTNINLGFDYDSPTFRLNAVSKLFFSYTLPVSNVGKQYVHFDF